MKETNNTDSNIPEKEIDLLDVASTVWSYKKNILIIIGVFIFLGLLFVKLSEKQFTASSKFIPRAADSNRMGGNLGGLASLAGINLGDMGSGSEIPPALYPTIISSVKFKKALLEAPVLPDGYSASMTYSQYYEDVYNPGPLHYVKTYTIGLPGTILSLFADTSRSSVEETAVQGDTSLIKLSKREVQHFSRLNGQIKVIPQDKQKIVELSFTMPEPLMAAQMARYAEALLQQELIAYKIQSAREQHNFTEQRFTEKKNEFETIQNRLAVFRDRNQNITSAIVMNQMDRLEAEYNFSFSIYTEMAKQLEQAKLQVSKDTPIFMVLEPVTIPTNRSSPNLIFIVIAFFIFGIIVSISYVFIKEVTLAFQHR